MSFQCSEDKQPVLHLCNGILSEIKGVVYTSLPQLITYSSGFPTSGRTFPRTRGFTEKFHQVVILCIDCLFYFIFFKHHFVLENSLLTTWSVQLSSVTQLCLTLCDPKACSMPGLPVHRQLLEFTQTHVHWVGDAIQLSHPLWYPSSPALCLSQHQGLFKWVSSSHLVARVLVLASASVFPMNTQDWSPLGWTGWISLQSKGLSRVFPNTTIQKHQFFRAQLSL